MMSVRVDIFHVVISGTQLRERPQKPDQPIVKSLLTRSSQSEDCWLKGTGERAKMS